MNKTIKNNSKLSMLKRQLKSGLLSHAYLFSGSDEIAKNDAISLILSDILGTDWKKNPDYMEIATEPITINEIRELKSRAYSAPISARKNVFVIRNIEKLSKDAAHALLKILEDPPTNALIIAETANTNILLPTILSRFSILRLHNNESSKYKISTGDADANLRFVENNARDNPTFLNIKCFEEAIWAKNALTDPTINKRLINEYLILLTK
jgi:DNA polymerase III delta prime subunit